MAATTAAVIGAAAAAKGTIDQRKAQKDAQKTAEQALTGNSTVLPSLNIYTPGGGFASYNANPTFAANISGYNTPSYYGQPVAGGSSGLVPTGAAGTSGRDISFGSPGFTGSTGLNPYYAPQQGTAGSDLAAARGQGNPLAYLLNGNATPDTLRTVLAGAGRVMGTSQSMNPLYTGDPVTDQWLLGQANQSVVDTRNLFGTGELGTMGSELNYLGGYGGSGTEPGVYPGVPNIPGITGNPFATLATNPSYGAPASNNIAISLGDVEPARAGLVQLAQQQVARAGLGGGVPQNIQDAQQVAQGLNLGSVDQQLGGLGFLEGLAGNTLSTTQNAFNNLSTNGFQNDLIQQAYNASRSQITDAGVTGQQATQNALSNFRAQALPEQQRAVAGTLSNLFSSGRLGTTGGANVIGRLAESQNLQDLQFQQAATAEGRAAQQNALGLASGFANIGGATQGLSEQLLQGAFSRFGNTASLAKDLNTERFSRGLQSQQFAREGANNNLNNLISQTLLGRELQGTDLNLALQALQGQSGLQQGGLNNLAAALGVAQAKANASIGAGSQIAALASNPNFGASPWTGIGDALLAYSARNSGGGSTSSGRNPDYNF